MDDIKRSLTPMGEDTEFYKLVADFLAEARSFAKIFT
jgi:hypothetical protein